MQVKTAGDPAESLSRYRAFAWMRQPPEAAQRPRAAELDQAVRDAVEKDLAAKHVVPAGDQEPDLLINYFGTSKTSVSYGYEPSTAMWGTSGYAVPHFERPYVSRLGSLTLQFIDAKTNRLVWEGSAEDAIGEKGASREQVTQAVNKMIEKYPVA